MEWYYAYTMLCDHNNMIIIEHYEYYNNNYDNVESKKHCFMVHVNECTRCYLVLL